MFTRISFENYRAFRRGSLRIAPITVLVGANSIGKSSILQIPLLFKQTYEQADYKYKAALKIHGKDVSFGNAKQVFHKQDVRKPVVFKFDFVDQALFHLIKQGLHERVADLQDELLQYTYYVGHSDAKGIPRDLTSKVRRIIESRSSSRTRDIPQDLMGEIIKFVGGLSSEKSDLPKFLYRPLTVGSGLTVTDFDLSKSFVSSLRSIRSPSFSVVFQLGYREGPVESTLCIRKFELFNEKANILSFDFSDDGESSISSDHFDRTIPKYIKSAIDESLNAGKSVFHFFSEKKKVRSYLFQSLIEMILGRTLSLFGSQFSSNAVSHIGPLRAHPRRFYFLDIAQPGSSEGELMIEALRENDDLRNQVNKWLVRFGINVSVSQFQEIIYRLSVKNADHPFDLDITDVGFGISQILPILVEGFLSPLEKTIMIEQPEIHLHPKMQAELADLFIDVANLKEKEGRRFVVVETHSEYFLNRLRARIAQGQISNTDVAIHNVEKIGADASVRGIYVPEDGSFEWPIGFLETDLEDTLAYLGVVK